MNENFSFEYKTQWFNTHAFKCIWVTPPLYLLPPADARGLANASLSCLLPPDSHLVPNISKIVKKINKNFRPLDSMPSSLDYLSKWAALR